MIEIDNSTSVLGDEIRETLQSGMTAQVRWAPGNGTAYELLLVPWVSTITMVQGDVERPQLLAEDGHAGWVYVARGYRGALYPIRLWSEDGENGRCPHPDYITEKLARGSVADGCALHILLCAVAECEPMCSWADADVL